ncbi:MAG: class E sortase [Mycobacteriales bacterium]
MLARIVKSVGEAFITLGVVVLLLVVYELWITGIFAAHTQEVLHRDLQIAWAQPQSPPLAQVPIGDGIAILRIPKFGRHYDPVIVQGVTTAALERGPGHYPGTAPPGGVGDFVVSGHRTTWGHWFFNLDQLHPGDSVVVQTRTRWFVYQVTSTEIVDPTDLASIAPVPDHPDAVPTKPMMTLTTCNPRYSASQRLIVHGILVQTMPTSAGAPAVLSQAA